MLCARQAIYRQGERNALRRQDHAVGNIPTVYLQTEKDMDYVHEDKEHKTGGTVRTYENGVMTLYAQWRPAAGEEDRPYRYVVLLNNYEYDMISSVLRMLWMFISYLPRAIFRS